MRRQFPAGLLAGAVLLACATTGEAQRPLSFGVSAGAAIPVSDLSESHKTGFNAAAHIGFNVPVLPVTARLEGFYSSFPARAEDIVGLRDGGIRIAGATGNVVYSFSGLGVRPYIIAGAGVYNSSYIRGSTTDPGFNAGLGARFALAGFDAFAEARLHRISDDDRQFQFVPVTFGIEF
jgi:hypothetical protein